MRLTIPKFHLQPGDQVRLAGIIGEVIRVTECAAVVALPTPPRQFTTIFGKTVRLQPKPTLARISPNSELEIINR